MFTRRVPSQSLKPALVVLENYYVAAPCHAPWDQMTGDHRIRHCAQCSLNVYNISEMTRNEAEELIRTHEGRLCVRYFQRTDGTILTKNCPRGLEMLVRRVSRIAGAVLTAAMSVGAAFSQTLTNGAQQTQENQEDSGIDLTVVDPTGALITNAQIHLCRCKDKGKIDVRTDASGVAHVRGLSKGRYSIEVTASGFKSRRQDIKIQPQKVEYLQVKLKVAPTNQTVDVTAAPVEVEGTIICRYPVKQEPLPWTSTGVGGRPSPLR